MKRKPKKNAVLTQDVYKKLALDDFLGTIGAEKIFHEDKSTKSKHEAKVTAEPKTSYPREGLSIAAIYQAESSNEDEGKNILRIEFTNGTVQDFVVKNGSKGNAGMTGLGGIRGPRGAVGERGPKGDKGEKGDPGSGIGQFTVDGSNYAQDEYADIRGEKFNDYDETDGNLALAPGSHAEGTRSIIMDGLTQTTRQNIAGCRGYEIQPKTEVIGTYTGPQITISDDRASGVIYLKGHVMNDTASQGSGAYAAGDVFSLITNVNCDDCGEIVSISETTLNLGLLYPTWNVTKIDVVFYPDKITNIETGSTVASVLPFFFKVNEKPLTGSYAIGLGAHTEGVGNQALSDGAHAEGRENKAQGRWSHAEGYRNKANYAAHAEGWGSNAIGQASHAEGHLTIATGFSAHAEGTEAQALIDQSHAEGLRTIAEGQASHVEGVGAHAVGSASHAEGTDTNAMGYSSHAEGVGAAIRNTAGESLLDGKYTVPEDHNWNSGSGAHAEGSDTVASNNGTHAEGVETYAIGSCAHTEGYRTLATAYQTHAEGYNTWAGGNYSHAEGSGSISSGSCSHAEGSGSISSGSCSHAEGNRSRAEDTNSHAEGGNTTASGEGSHAEGNGTVASGYSAHAEGTATQATGGHSHSEGLCSKATGDHAHAEGYQTTASGDHAHAEGDYTVASGAASHATGRYTVAGYEHQCVVGVYNNNKADTLFEVGNGTSAVRSNAFEVTKDGTAKLGGNSVPTVSSGQEALLYIGDTQPAATAGKITVWINLSGAVEIIQ